jgi:NADP-dependent 3-hydroxy acid dehydrogenase YdfG
MRVDVFKDSVVVITGASSGIEEALACQLADRGAWLSLVARDEFRLKIVADRCRSWGGCVLVVPTGVCEEAECERLINKTMSEYKRVDTLINNAGFTMWARFE